MRSLNEYCFSPCHSRNSAAHYKQRYPKPTNPLALAQTSANWAMDYNIQLTIYQVLARVHARRADAALAEAYVGPTATADSISDGRRRHDFLSNLPKNREITAFGARGAEMFPSK